MIKFLGFFSLIMIFVAGSVLAENDGRIYGKITTTDGDILEGLIRWDKNEGSWVDILNGTKDLSNKKSKKYSETDRRKQNRNKETSIEIFGISLGKTSSSNWTLFNSAQSGIRFGHIKSLEPIGDDRALLVLKSGEEVELFGGSTDIGNGIREIIIEDEEEGEVELLWDDIELIEFMPANYNDESMFGERLYGTLTTRRGDEFTGFVCWDVDELFGTDILDGDEDGRDRKIKFGKIKSIERYSSNGATIVLTNGDELLLKNSNDIDDGNRGIIISDPGFGQIVIMWDDFDKLIFSEAPHQVKYSDFDGGHPLMGTVYSEDGESYTGQIRWDDDEEYSWEILDGDYHDIEFDVEFGLIKKIEKKSQRTSIITTLDGRTFRLRGSNDVDSDNKGIFIETSADDEVKLDWDEFSYVEFKK